MSTASEPIVPRPRPAPPRLSILPEPPPTPPAPQRAPWGRMGLLVGSAIIIVAGLAAYKLLTIGSNNPADSKLNGGSIGVPASAQVVCRGVADVDGGMLNLTPTQPGEIVEILVKEGQVVKQNDPLLKVNDEPAQIAVKSAQAGLENADALLAQAKQGLEMLQLGLKKQQSAIDAAQAKLASAEYELSRAENLIKLGQGNENQLKSAREMVKALNAALAAEQTEYRRIQANQPELKIKEAQAGVQVASERLRGEKLKLEHCTLRAPSDGTVVRINVAKGALISPQMQQPPIVFCPSGVRIVRAEVLPEFAARVQDGMEATITDESNPKITWTGKVRRLSDAFLPAKRTNQSGALLSLNGDQDTLEAIVELTSTNSPPRIGQKVRVFIGPKQ